MFGLEKLNSIHLVTYKQFFKYQKKNLQINYIFPRRVSFQSGAKNSKAVYAFTFLMIFIKCDAFACIVKDLVLTSQSQNSLSIHICLDYVACNFDDDVISYSPDLHDF